MKEIKLLLIKKYRMHVENPKNKVDKSALNV